jgi:hypothetical protein
VKKTGSIEPALLIESTASSGKLRVSVTRCQAVTQGGHYIQIGPAQAGNVTAQADLTDGAVAVYIGVVPDRKHEVGDPDPAEEVPRTPFRTTEYRISLKEPPNLPEGNFLKVASLVVSGSEVVHAGDFYPPCISLNADERLAQKAVEFRNRLENVLSLSSRAFMAISSSGALAGEKTDLQVAFKDTVYSLAHHLASTLDTFVLGRNAIHPMWMVIRFKGLFRVLSTLLNLHPGLKDYLNEKHFSKERGSEIGKFLSSIDSFLLSDYDHQNIGSHVAQIESNLAELRGVLGFLAQTKKEELGREATAQDTLTYNGRTYRISPYKSAKLERVGELSYLLIDLDKPQAVSDAVVLMTKDLFSQAIWTNMQVRFGINEARGLGETDPVNVDAVTFAAKVALRPQDILKSASVRRVTLIFRGASDSEKLANLGKLDLMLYTM